jgi:hypothetical protein
MVDNPEVDNPEVATLTTARRCCCRIYNFRVAGNPPGTMEFAFQALILLLGDLARTDLPAKNERKARGNGSRARAHFSITQRFS